MQKTNLKKLVIIKAFLALILSITNACAMTPNSTYDTKNNTTKYLKPLAVPISVPIDITKKGNKLEFEVKIKEDHGYSFELEFYYDDPRSSRYEWVEILKSFFPDKKYTHEEYREMMKDYNRVRELLGYKDTRVVVINGAKEIKHISYPGIPTPIHLTIVKLEKDGSEKIIFDRDVEELENLGPGGRFYKKIVGMGLKPGIYKISTKTLKDSPELIGTKIHLWIAKPHGKA